MALNRARIAVDAMGGDYAPDEIVAGALQAQDELGAEVLLVGDPAAIEASLQRHDRSSDEVQIIASEGAVEMHEEALTGIKRKPNASINVAMNLVKQGEADGVVSAGHSGASMASALLRLGRLAGIDRPAIGAVFPTMNPNKSVLLLDVGAIVDCRPKFLEQFALLGTVYSQYVLGRDEPRVGLLNIGEEACKGNELALRTYELLQNNPRIPFVGNAEGRDVLSGDFDVIVCDGFVGNVLLKFAEAVGNILLQLCQDELLQGLDERDLDHVMPNLKRLKQRIDYVEHGGGLLLGVAGVCVIGHGSSHAMTIFNAVRLAKEAVDNRVIERIQEKHLVEQ
ncbi:phosphate acyltransferase PlsX [Phormidium yuhuli AB48]|uniref:Phosphate acyltransferase n=1 Tax=Phormidium yuhuli AB48 TaxID=2940671 RepID=A0ABY5ARA9_9CYAN|nr:phosphate acyltransferase PlsX [Phormidium yuhuli]USR91403.1 phosphate acyltransferase PlsX [Phormidium yuhuli AB48]